MEADEAAEMMDQDELRDRFKQRAAVAIAILAMVLAICSLGGSNAGKEAVNNNVLASNYFNFFQAKNMRQTSLMLAADELEYGWLNDPAIGESTKRRCGPSSTSTARPSRATNPSRTPARARRS